MPSLFYKVVAEKIISVGLHLAANEPNALVVGMAIVTYELYIMIQFQSTWSSVKITRYEKQKHLLPLSCRVFYQSNEIK